MYKVELKRRPVVVDADLPDSIHPLLSRVYASRGISSGLELERGLAKLAPYDKLEGISQAVECLVSAVQQNRKIVIVGDFDADGATSTALAILALRQMGITEVDYLIPNRFDDGYGLSPEVVEQARNKGAQLIITVDNGIASFDGVALANQYQIPVIITDHHLPGDTLPDAAVIINPNLATCHFPSKNLAGVGVVFYFMLALRAHLRSIGWFEQRQLIQPNLAEYLDLVALGTVADVVALDFNNRILVYQGLNRIRAGACRVGIQALLDISARDNKNLVASDLGFALAPRINAAGRLENMSIGVELLLSDDPRQAREYAFELDSLNKARREIEADMQHDALQFCQQFETEQNKIPNALAMYHPQWHQGVVGIVASRIKERFHRPVIAFASAGDGIIKGSGRSIAGFHLRDALERLNTLHPQLIIRFGGHAMAAGLSIYEEKFADFQYHFNTLAGDWLDMNELQGIIWSDGELDKQDFNLSLAELLRQSGPWGQAFPEPMFDGQFTLLQQRLVGGRHLKLLVEPSAGGPMLDAIAFNIDTKLWPDSSIRQVRLAYRLDVNEFRGDRNVQLLIEHLWPV